MIYKSKPSEVEAIQWTGDNFDEVVFFTSTDNQSKVYSNIDGLVLLAGVNGSQGYVPVPVGHWLVCKVGDKSDIWPVEDGYFTSKYELKNA